MSISVHANYANINSNSKDFKAGSCGRS